MWPRGWAVAPKYSAPAINTFLQCLSSLVVPWKTDSRLWKIGSSLVSAELALGFAPQAGFADKKVLSYFHVGGGADYSDFPLLVSLYLFGESASYLTDKNIMI